VVPPQDEVALAEAIIHYFAARLRPDMERRVQQDAQTNVFAWNKLVACIEDIEAG